MFPVQKSTDKTKPGLAHAGEASGTANSLMSKAKLRQEYNAELTPAIVDRPSRTLWPLKVAAERAKSR
jgi:hypothetical protein